MNDTGTTDLAELPRWSVADVHESLEARSFVDAFERVGAETTRLVALFDEHDVRATAPRPVTDDDGRAADAVITAYNDVITLVEEIQATVYATVATDSRDERAQRLLSRLADDGARLTPRGRIDEYERLAAEVI